VHGGSVEVQHERKVTCLHSNAIAQSRRTEPPSGSQTCNIGAILCVSLLTYSTRVAMSTTILVIEDEPAIQELIAVNLSFAGHKVLRAFDAEQAQTLIRAELPDLILLDWMLPGVS